MVLRTDVKYAYLTLVFIVKLMWKLHWEITKYVYYTNGREPDKNQDFT